MGKSAGANPAGGGIGLVAAFAGGAMLAGPGAAQAQTYLSDMAFGGSAGQATMNASWSVLRVSGPTCNAAGTTATLYHHWSSGSMSGFDGVIGGFQPRVVFNYATVPFTFGGWTIPARMVAMHPGPGGECAVLRLTIPAGGAGRYAIRAGFRGAYPGSSTGGGDGVRAMVLRNGSVIGQAVDTASGPGWIGATNVILCAGDRVDFAVHMKADANADDTILVGRMGRRSGMPPLACFQDPVPTDGAVRNHIPVF